MVLGRPKLGNILIESGVVSEAELEEALQYQMANGCRLGEALVGLSLCTDKQIAKALAEQMESAFVDLQETPPEPACVALMTNRDETQKHGQALSVAGQKKLPPEEVCKLFKVFLASETKMVKGLEQNSALCGVPPDVIKQVKAQHNKAEEMAKRVCEVAAQGARPTGPSLSDALGTTPVVPDASNSKRGAGTFDTLEGSPLTR